MEGRLEGTFLRQPARGLEFFFSSLDTVLVFGFHEWANTHIRIHKYVTVELGIFVWIQTEELWMGRTGTTQGIKKD